MRVRGAVVGTLLFVAVGVESASAQTAAEAAIEAVIESAYIDGIQRNGDRSAIRAGFDPGFVMKVLGDISFEQELNLDREAGVMRWTLRPSRLADRMRESGLVRCDAVGDDRCRRRVTIELEAKIFGVGSLIEANAEKTHREMWAQRARFTNDWLRKRGATS